MKTPTQDAGGSGGPLGADFFDKLWEESWTYIKTVVDVLREPVVILDGDLRVMTANESFYRLFQVDSKETEGKNIYELGNGQWDVPALKKLLEDILPKNSFFKGFEVDHEFPVIGRKVMVLNGRRIHFTERVATKPFPPIILLAIEDVTHMMDVADMLASHTNKFQAQMAERAEKLDKHIKKLEKEISDLKKKL